MPDRLTRSFTLSPSKELEPGSEPLGEGSLPIPLPTPAEKALPTLACLDRGKKSVNPQPSDTPPITPTPAKERKPLLQHLNQPAKQQDHSEEAVDKVNKDVDMEVPQKGLFLVDWSNVQLDFNKRLYTNPVTGQQGGVPPQPVALARDTPGNPVNASLLNAGGLRPGTENTANIGIFGSPRPNNTSKKHLGIDLYAKIGQEVFAAHPGRVTVSKSPKGGTSVTITGSTPDGKPLKTVYSHLKDALKFKNGAHVDQGCVIGHAGISGNARSYINAPQHHHLHFSVYIDGQAVNGIEFLNRK